MAKFTEVNACPPPEAILQRNYWHGRNKIKRRNDFKIKPGKKGRTYGVSKREMPAIGFTNIADFSFRSIKNDCKLSW